MWQSVGWLLPIGFLSAIGHYKVGVAKKGGAWPKKRGA